MYNLFMYSEHFLKFNSLFSEVYFEYVATYLNCNEIKCVALILIVFWWASQRDALAAYSL